MIGNLPISNVLNSIVPISRFNKGEASKIFDEVNKSGYKIVVKNNKPACVLITPEVYQEIVEALEDYKLYIEAEKRMKNATDQDFVSEEDVMTKFDITQKDLDAIGDVGIE